MKNLVEPGRMSPQMRLMTIRKKPRASKDLRGATSAQTSGSAVPRGRRFFSGDFAGGMRDRLHQEGERRKTKGKTFDTVGHGLDGSGGRRRERVGFARY